MTLLNTQQMVFRNGEAAHSARDGLIITPTKNQFVKNFPRLYKFAKYIAFDTSTVCL